MNKFIVNSEILLKALQIVAKVIERHALVPIIESYLFQVSNGQLTIKIRSNQRYCDSISPTEELNDLRVIN